MCVCGAKHMKKACQRSIMKAEGVSYFSHMLQITWFFLLAAHLTFHREFLLHSEGETGKHA